MAEYDLREKPPAPYVNMQVTNVENGFVHSLRAKLDTCASISVLPEPVVEALALDPKGEGRFWGYEGIPSVRSLYYVVIEVAGLRLPPMRVIASHRSEALLGRDVLNHFIIILDGKALTFEMRDP